MDCAVGGDPATTGVTATIVRLTDGLVEEMIGHALADAPLECCGILAARDGLVVKLYPAANFEASPYRFSIEAREQFRIGREMDAEGTGRAGFYHSHTGSDARPSPTDIRMMGPLFGPPYVHFVIGVADREYPVARVFFIEDGTATELRWVTCESPGINGADASC